MDKLVEFYERYGFEVDDVQGGTGVFMTRKAKETDGTDLSDGSDAEHEPEVKCSPVVDPELLKQLEAEEKRGEYLTFYRAAQLVDGKLYSPMAAKVNKQWTPEIKLGRWEQADERPDLAIPSTDKKTGKQKTYSKKTDEGYGNPAYHFKLNKGNGSIIEAAYNPYIHSSPTPLNDQFSEAYKRPELVTLEVRVPKSELTASARRYPFPSVSIVPTWKR